MRSVDLVRRYFDREAARFDAIYEERKPLFQRLVDRLFRGVILERFRLVCNLAPSSGPWTVLDVGCGSGRYAIALADAGAVRVVGIDLSSRMLDLARSEAMRANVVDRCDFITGRFTELGIDEKFDVVVATGYFDYLEDPTADLQKMVSCSRGRIFASFPKRYEPRAVVRKLRFLLAGGYVRFYSRAQILRLFVDVGVPRDRLSLIDLGRDVLAIARVD